jgi:hypothetical protein
MADLTIRVPSELVDPIADQLLQRYATLAGALHAAAVRYASARAALDALRGARVELFDVDDAVEQLHWGLGSAGTAPVEVSAHPEVLADAVAAAVAAAHDRPTRQALEALLAEVMGW